MTPGFQCDQCKVFCAWPTPRGVFTYNVRSGDAYKDVTTTVRQLCDECADTEAAALGIDVADRITDDAGLDFAFADGDS